MQRYTVNFIWKLLYMFRVVPPPIIRSANNWIYSIWYWFECAVHTQTCSNSSMIVAGSSNSVTNNRCCRYSCLRYHLKHVKQFPDKINCVTLHLVGHILEHVALFHCLFKSIWTGMLKNENSSASSRKYTFTVICRSHQFSTICQQTWSHLMSDALREFK
jgi:hypothetical protein